MSIWQTPAGLIGTLTAHRLAMGNVRILVTTKVNLLAHVATQGSVPHRTYSHHRSSENRHFLYSKTEVEGYSRFRVWDISNITTMALVGFPGRTLRYCGPFWRLLRHNRILCREHSCRRSLHTAGIAETERRPKKRRTSSLKLYSTRKTCRYSNEGTPRQRDDLFRDTGA